MGMRTRREVRESKEAGNLLGGGERGRKPLEIETVKGGSLDSSSPLGMDSKTGKAAGGMEGPIVIQI